MRITIWLIGAAWLFSAADANASNNNCGAAYSIIYQNGARCPDGSINGEELPTSDCCPAGSAAVECSCDRSTTVHHPADHPDSSAATSVTLAVRVNAHSYHSCVEKVEELLNLGNTVLFPSSESKESYCEKNFPAVGETPAPSSGVTTSSFGEVTHPTEVEFHH